MEQNILLQKDNHTFVSIDDIEEIYYDDDVFDMEVDSDNTFYVSTDNNNFVLTHNSGYPDVDLDFESKEEVTKLMREVYGTDNVISISNFNTLQLRSLIKDISKFYQIPFQEVNKVTRVIDNEVRSKVLKKGDDKNLFQLTLQNATDFSPTFQEFIKKYPEVKTHIDVLYQNIKSISRHAGGLLIADDLDSKMPIIISKDERQSPWTEGVNYKHLEELGFLKFDCLALLTLRIIRSCIEKILKSQNKDTAFSNVRNFYDKYLHPDNMDLKDQNVFKNVWHDSKYPAVFQFSERGAQRFGTLFKPTSVDDISAITSIFRPGPLAADVDKQYVKAKNSTHTMSFDHPAIEEVLGQTYGYLIFQEQVMSLANKLAGMSLSDCDTLRKVILKRTLKGQTEAFSKRDQLKIKFIEGCVKNNYPEQNAKDLFQKIEYAAGYLFNKSHSLSYSLISYQCAWLFTYFEKEWLAAYLEHKEGADKKEKVIKEIKTFGYEFKKPDINLSSGEWRIEGKDIFFSLSALKGLGPSVVKKIIKNQPYRIVEDLLYIKESALNKKTLSVLARVGALDSLNIIGKDKQFESYKHFYDVVVENLTAIKHPKKGRATLEALIEEHKNKGEWTNEEKIASLSEIMGTVDVDLVITPHIAKKLEEKNIKSIDDFDTTQEEDIVWFIVTDFKVRLTKAKKEFAILNVLGETGLPMSIKQWGYKDGIYDKYGIYAARVAYQDEWGYSIRSRANVIRLD